MSQVLVNSTRWSLLLKITGILFLLSFVVSKIIILPGYLSATLALAWILYVPFGLGSLFTHLPIKPIQSFSNELYKIKFVNIVVKWFLGFFLIISLTSIFLLGQFRIEGVLGLSLLTVSSISNFFFPSKIGKNFKKNTLLLIIIILILGILFAAYVRSFSPYPLSPGMDTFTHMYVIKSILNNSPNSPLVYPPTFDMMIALSSNTFNADLTEVFWAGPFLLFPLLAISLYTMSYRFTRNHSHALLTTIIGLAITEMGLIANVQFFFPASFTMSIFPGILFVMDSIWSISKINKKSSCFFTLIVLGGYILLHLPNGVVGSILIIVYLIFFHSVKNNLFNFLIKICTMFLTIILFLYYLKYLTSQIIFPNIHKLFNLQEPDDYSYVLSTKIMHLTTWYTNEIIILSLLGLFAISLSKERKTSILGFISAIFLIIYFQDITYIHRSMALERPLIAFAAAALLVTPLNIFESKFIKKMKSRLKREKYSLQISRNQINAHAQESG